MPKIKSSKTRKPGRPSKYSAELAAKICDVLSKSRETIEITLASLGINFHTFYTWRDRNPRFEELVTRAMAQRDRVIAETLLDYADSDPLKGDRSDSPRARLHDTRIRARQWWLTRRLPGQFGDKLSVDADVTFVVPNFTAHLPEGRASRALRPGELPCYQCTEWQMRKASGEKLEGECPACGGTGKQPRQPALAANTSEKPISFTDTWTGPNGNQRERRFADGRPPIIVEEKES
jgi:hypothetical protein